MKVFVGYPSERLAAAQDIADFIESLGHSVWFDKRALIGGEDWDRGRTQGQQEADLIVHLCGPEIVRRPGVVNREIKESLRLNEDQPLGSIFLVPIRMEDFRLPLELSRFHYIDYFRPSWRDQLAETLVHRQSQLHTDRPPIFEATPPTRTDASTLGPAFIEFTDSGEHFVARGSYVQYGEAGTYWSFINSLAASRVLTQFYSWWGRGSKPDPEPIPYTYEWEMTCKEFYRDGQLVSLRLYEYMFTGGAHGNHSITTLNFLGPDVGLVGIDALLKPEDDTSVERIFNRCIAQLAQDRKEYYDVIEAISSYSHGRQRTRDEMRYLLSRYTFDRVGLTINFDPYDILPYSEGAPEVFLPWSDIAGELNPYYYRYLTN